MIFETDYFVEIPGGTVARCNPVNAPTTCRSKGSTCVLATGSPLSAHRLAHGDRPARERGAHAQVIKINAITVPEGSGDELAKRFAARAGAVDDQDGFEGFELLQPTDERTTWLVVTRWRDEAAFEAWVSSPAFGARTPLEQERSGGDAPRRSRSARSCGRTRWPAAPTPSADA